MTSPKLDGPLGDKALRDIVLGGCAPAEIGDTEIARLDHYARATGLSHVSGERYGDAEEGAPGRSSGWRRRRSWAALAGLRPRRSISGGA